MKLQPDLGLVDKKHGGAVIIRGHQFSDQMNTLEISPIDKSTDFTENCLEQVRRTF